MKINVIYSDLSTGRVEISGIGQLIILQKITAVMTPDGWVEIRPKRNNKDYSGPERRRSGDVVMETKVIYRDGSIGVVDASTVDKIRAEGEIAAYQVSHKWVEVRRKQVSDPNYQGPERRKSHFIIH